MRFLLCLMVCFLVSVGFGETIKIGFFDLEPYAIKQADGTYTGAAIEYFEKYHSAEDGRQGGVGGASSDDKGL